MTRRLSGEQRRAQIVQAALELLGDRGVGSLSTRAIAARVGITQPALFRHFRNRDAILESAISESRERMATEVLASIGSGSARQQLRQLALALIEYSGRAPWLPQLLFHVGSMGPDEPLRPVLMQLPAMQRALVAELVRQGQRAGEFPETVDTELAATMLVSLVQGCLLSVRIEGVDPITCVTAGVDMWLGGIDAGMPAGRAEPESRVEERLIWLDAKSIFDRGEDPLPDVLAALGRLGDDGLLLFTVPFRPEPLIHLLGSRGHEVRVTNELGGFALWIGQSPLLDLRDLEAPEPMEQVLLAVAALRPGQSIRVCTPRVPRLLLPRLSEDGMEHCWLEVPIGGVLLYVRRPE